MNQSMLIAIRVFALVLVLLAFPLVPAKPAFAACPILSGTDAVYKFAGMYEVVSGVQGVYGSLRAYNPTPVFYQTTFWTMLDNNSTTSRWAQVGWRKLPGWSTEYVWRQYTDDNGVHHDLYYNASLDTWTGTPSTIPASPEAYQVLYVSGSPGTFWFYYAAGSPNGVQNFWVPSRANAMGETGNYAAPDKGDHAPGDLNNRIYGDNLLKMVGGTWVDLSPPADHPIKEGHMDADRVGAQGVGFRVWDKRCSE